MEATFAAVVGLTVAVATYLLLARNVLSAVVGFLVLSNGVNLAIFIAGRFPSSAVPIVPEGADTLAVSANPLPQALLLTAIVISFALAAFATVLFDAASESLDTLDTDAMREAEPETAPLGKEARQQ